jgi:hypothetical protein
VADNYVANAGSGGSTFASDDISSVHYARVKTSVGPDGVAQDGYSFTRVVSAATTNGTVIKAGPAELASLSFFNTNAASVRWLKLHNSTTVTPGTTAVVMTIPIPPAANSSGAAGFHFVWPDGLTFTTGMCISITAAAGDADTTAISANEVYGVIGWA